MKYDDKEIQTQIDNIKSMTQKPRKFTSKKDSSSRQRKELPSICACRTQNIAWTLTTKLPLKKGNSLLLNLYGARKSMMIQAPFSKTTTHLPPINKTEIVQARTRFQDRRGFARVFTKWTEKVAPKVGQGWS